MSAAISIVKFNLREALTKEVKKSREGKEGNDPLIKLGNKMLRKIKQEMMEEVLDYHFSSNRVTKTKLDSYKQLLNKSDSYEGNPTEQVKHKDRDFFDCIIWLSLDGPPLTGENPYLEYMNNPDLSDWVFVEFLFSEEDFHN